MNPGMLSGENAVSVKNMMILKICRHTYRRTTKHIVFTIRHVRR
jgi:hypothetical protein